MEKVTYLTNKEQLDIAEEYCCNNGKKIKILCHLHSKNIGGITQKDYDDLYSLGQLVLYNCLKKYNKNKSACFDTFFQMVLKERIKDCFVRNRNRQCRSNVIKKNENTVFLNDIYFSSLTYEPEYNDVYLEDDKMINVSEKIQIYLNKLSKKQRELAFLIMDGYNEKGIKEILKINKSQYNNLMKGLKAYRNIELLF